MEAVSNRNPSIQSGSYNQFTDALQSTPYDSPTSTPYGSFRDRSSLERSTASNQYENRDHSEFSDCKEELYDSTSETMHIPKGPHILPPPDEENGAETAASSSEQPQPSFFRSLSGHHWLTLLTLCLGNISAALFYSLLAPFFPTEAKLKGASDIEIGAIFGIFSVIQFIFSPFFGYYIKHFGAKFLFVTGNAVCSTCAVLFGALMWCPNGSLFVSMCFVVRLVESTAAAAENTASAALAVWTFPNHVSTVMGILSACSFIGLMLGPPIGGLLFAAGNKYHIGYFLPFAVTGGTFMVFSVFSFFILPQPDGDPPSRTSRQSKLRLLRVPIVLVIGFMLVMAQAAMGFFDVGFAPHVNYLQPGLSTAYIGLIFCIPAFIIMLLAPIYGCLNDRYRKLGRPLMVLGITVGAIAFLGIGPSPIATFLPQRSIWVAVLSLVISATGWGAMIVTYQEFVDAATRAGYPSNLETQGIISGINSSFNSLGSFLGPVLGGVMLDALGFGWSSTIMAGCLLLAGINLAVYMFFNRFCCNCETVTVDTTDTENEPLLS